MAAKRRTSLLVLLASARAFCVSTPVSGHSVLHLETRAELLAENRQDRVEPSLLVLKLHRDITIRSAKLHQGSL